MGMKCVHGVEGNPYWLAWRGNTPEQVGNYFPCCGVRLDYTARDENMVKAARDMEEEGHNVIINEFAKQMETLWGFESLVEGDADRWRDRGELDARYGFGRFERETPYLVHEAILYLNELDSTLSYTAMMQLHDVVPNSIGWEVDDFMSSDLGKRPIGDFFDVEMFRTIARQSGKNTMMTKAAHWLFQNYTGTTDPLSSYSNCLIARNKLGMEVKTTVDQLFNILNDSTKNEVFLNDIEMAVANLKNHGVPVETLDNSEFEP